jgi:hypothetical protein
LGVLVRSLVLDCVLSGSAKTWLCFSLADRVCETSEGDRVWTGDSIDDRHVADRYRVDCVQNCGHTWVNDVDGEGVSQRCGVRVDGVTTVERDGIRERN